MSVRGEMQLAVLFTVGLLVGVWVFISPWVLGYPAGPRGTWSPSTLSQAVVGAVVAVASGIAMVAIVARALRLALIRPAEKDARATGGGAE